MNCVLMYPILALLWQSNTEIAQAISGGNGLAPDLTAYTGITGIFAQFFLIMISAIGGFVKNYGLAVILTAIIVRVFLLPLTRQQIQSMRSMQLLQPVMKQIQRHYPNKQDQSAKTMELYQRYKINPLAGCLPLIIQFPILFGVYRALYDPSFAGKEFLGIQLLFPVNVTSGRSFGVGPALGDLIDITVAELGLQGQIMRLPESIPLIGGSFWYLPALALVVLYVASSLFMQRLMRRVNQPDPEFVAAFKEEMKSRGKEDQQPEQPDAAQQMQKQMGFMNLIIIIFAFIFSTGALLYFIVQNLLMMVEYTLIPRMASGPSLDPKELKSFIRQPPPPIGKQQAAPAAKSGQQDTAAEAAANSEETREDTLTAEGQPETTAQPLRRPRKKRRKR